MLKNYLKIAWKVLLRRKFFTFISLFVISFTLMILLVITSMVDHAMGANSPQSNIDRMLFFNRIKGKNSEKGWSSQNSVHYEFMKKYVKTLKTPEKVSLISNTQAINAYITNKKLILDLKNTDEIFWEVTDFQFIEGNGYSADDVDKANKVVVINEHTKKEYFGDASAVGQSINLDGENFKVCGVVKDVSVSNIVFFADVWTPLSTAPSKLEGWNEYHGYFFAVLLAKNKEDFPLIKDEFAAIMEHINTLPHPKFDKHFAILESLLDMVYDFFAPYKIDESGPKVGKLISIISIIIFLFMLLPSINLININVSRIMERTSEIGARRAFGATKAQLVHQFMIENLILTFLGACVGVVLALMILTMINESEYILYSRLSINFSVLFYGLFFTVFFGLLSGVYPAFKMSQLQPVNALKGAAL